MDETDGPLYQAWLAYCVAVINDLAVTVTFANELVDRDAPRPSGVYLTLNIIAGPSGNNGISELRRNADIFEVYEPLQATLSIQGFRSGSKALLEKIRALLDSPRDTEVLKESSIAIVDKGTITDISAALGAGFERRYSLDVIFNTTRVEPTSLGPIESVSISGTGHDGAAGDVAIGPFTVSKP